jgi:hypothetical protein
MQWLRGSMMRQEGVLLVALEERRRIGMELETELYR